MANVKLNWNPKGFELSSIGEKKFDRITDGDTPFISMSIRMLSIDAPEVHYNGDPANHNPLMTNLANWIKGGKAPVDPGLAKYLYPKLASGTAGTLQKKQGDDATVAFNNLLTTKLTRSTGKKRNLFLRVASQQPFDQYGRLLAYIAPSYSEKEIKTMTRHDRATFNLLLVESGWAASFPIYPDLPKQEDLVLLHDGAEKALKHKYGIWSSPNTLAGYEYRMCCKLWKVTSQLETGKTLSAKTKSGWIERYCVDMTTLKLYNPQDYYKVEPFNRVFIWPKDVKAATSKLNLVP